MTSIGIHLSLLRVVFIAVLALLLFSEGAVPDVRRLFGTSLQDLLAALRESDDDAPLPLPDAPE